MTCLTRLSGALACLHLHIRWLDAAHYLHDGSFEVALGDLPRRFDRKEAPTRELTLPAGADVAAALDRVLRLPAVCSKRFLTTKVDRHVTGLIAQQQCVGPLQLPVSDVAVMAQTHFGYTGSATAIGEQARGGEACGICVLLVFFVLHMSAAVTCPSTHPSARSHTRA